MCGISWLGSIPMLDCQVGENMVKSLSLKVGKRRCFVSLGDQIIKEAEEERVVFESKIEGAKFARFSSEIRESSLRGSK